MPAADDPDSTEVHGPTQDDYVIFLRQLRQVLGYVASEPQGLLSTQRRSELRRVLDETLGPVGSPTRPEQAVRNIPSERLAAEGLTGWSGWMKLDGWRRRKDRFLDWMNRNNARSCLNWAAGVLDSLSAIAPPLKVTQELVSAAGNLLADAEDAAR